VIGQDQNHFTVDNRAGSTHPGAERGPMCSRLMLSMVPGVFRRLDLGQPTDK
jgi:hypothetical protein